MADELLNFSDTGTISCTIGGTRYLLRRPKFGELRELWEAWDEASDDVQSMVDPHLERLDELAGIVTDATVSPEDKREARAERKRINTEVRQEQNARWALWVRQVFGMLCTTPLPESDDDLEAWLLTALNGADFIGHWQKRPLASG